MSRNYFNFFSKTDQRKLKKTFVDRAIARELISNEPNSSAQKRWKRKYKKALIERYAKQWRRYLDRNKRPYGSTIRKKK